MKLRSWTSLGPLLLLILGACRPERLRPAEDRDGAGTVFGATCEHLRELRCPEGFEANGRTCYQRLLRREMLVEIPTECVGTAETQEAVRECGDATTLTFGCKP